GVPIPTTSLSDRGSSAGEGITISQNCVNTTPGDTPILGTASTRRPKISRTKMQKITTRLAHDPKPGRGARPGSHPRRGRADGSGASGGPRACVVSSGHCPGSTRDRDYRLRPARSSCRERESDLVTRPSWTGTKSPRLLWNPTSEYLLPKGRRTTMSVIPFGQG